jgi:hypothetical protein
MDGSVRTIAMLFFIFVGATAFAYVFRHIGGEHFIVETARSFAVGDWGLLAMMMIMIFVMGFFFDWIEITLIVLPIFAPIVQIMDLGDHIAQRRPDLLVRGAGGGESANLLPDAALRLCAVLPQGRGGGGRDHGAGLSRDHSLRLVAGGVLGLLIWQPQIVLALPDAVLR